MTDAEPIDYAAELEWIAKQAMKSSDFGNLVVGLDYDVLVESAALIRRQAEDNARLSSAIRLHRDQRGDDRCWADDYTLYMNLGEPVPLDMSALPPKEDFLKSCERYYEQRRCPLDVYPPGKMRIAELESEVARLRKLLAELEWSVGILSTLCPNCWMREVDGHAPDCPLKAALDGH